MIQTALLLPEITLIPNLILLPSVISILKIIQMNENSLIIYICVISLKIKHMCQLFEDYW